MDHANAENGLRYILPIDEDDKIVGRILTRRQTVAALSFTSLAALIGCGGAGGASSTVATGSATNTSGTTGTSSGTSTTGTTGGTIDLVATPQVTEGPFFVDENLNRSDLASSGASRASVANGTPLTLRFAIYELAGSTGSPLAGAHVDVWHADAVGAYSDEAGGSIQSENTQGQTWLRGYQVTDANGGVEFQTIWPGWYTGRTVHIHLKVRLYNASGNETYEFTTQMFFTDAQSDAVVAMGAYDTRGARSVKNANDNVYSALQSDGTTVGSHLLMNLSDTAAGKVATFSIALNAV